MMMKPRSKPEQFKNKVTPNDPGFYRELLEHMSDGVYFVDRDRRIQYWNEGATRLTGYTADEITGRYCQDDILCHVDTEGTRLCQEGCPLTACIEDGGFHQASVFLRHKQGRRVPVLVRVQPLRGDDGSIVGAIEIFSDDSAQSEIRRRIESMKRLAFLDHLTQLPNRRFLEMSLETALIEFERHGDALGVLMLDLDDFKRINDTFGHSCGDRVLQEFGQTIAGALRPDDTVGRWGGDEFLAIVRNVNMNALHELAARCVTLVRQMAVPGNDERQVFLSISIGCALSRPGESAKELVQRADELMYESKSDGRGCSAAD